MFDWLAEHVLARPRSSGGCFGCANGAEEGFGGFVPFGDVVDELGVAGCGETRHTRSSHSRQTPSRTERRHPSAGMPVTIEAVGARHRPGCGRHRTLSTPHRTCVGAWKPAATDEVPCAQFDQTDWLVMNHALGEIAGAHGSLSLHRLPEGYLETRTASRRPSRAVEASTSSTVWPLKVTTKTWSGVSGSRRTLTGSPYSSK